MIKTAIIDDDPQAVEEIKDRVLKVINSDEIATTGFSNEDEFILTVENGNNYDIVFIDILLGSSDGISLAQKLLQITPNTNIIFISANPQYFQDVYRVPHSYFLIKPYDNYRFNDAVRRAFRASVNRFFTIEIKGINRRFDFNSINYLENRLKQTLIVYTDGNEELLPVPLLQIASFLPESIFLRTHQSFIINMDHYCASQRQIIILTGQTEIPISKKYAKSVQKKLTMYFGGI